MPPQQSADTAGPIRCWENIGRLSLSDTLDWCVWHHGVDTLLVISRPTAGKRFDPAADRSVRSIFGDKVIKSFCATAWPGTALVSKAGTRRLAVGRVYVIRFDDAVKRAMIETEDEIFEWLYTRDKVLPEDVCLFREGARLPVLISVTHEREAWILSDSPVRPPGFRPGDLRTTLQYVWNGPYFCRLP